MATFPSIKPAFGETQTIEQDNIVVKLGDGYEQRLVRGLAANKRRHTVSLVFNISQTYIYYSLYIALGLSFLMNWNAFVYILPVYVLETYIH